MLRHVVVFGWSEDSTAGQRQRVATELSALPSLIPAIRSYHFGPDAGINENSWDFAVVADFDDVASYESYRDDPRHRAIIDQHITPITARRAAVQYEF